VWIDNLAWGGAPYIVGIYGTNDNGNIGHNAEVESMFATHLIMYAIDHEPVICCFKSVDVDSVQAVVGVGS